MFLINSFFIASFLSYCFILSLNHSKLLATLLENVQLSIDKRIWYLNRFYYRYYFCCFGVALMKHVKYLIINGEPDFYIYGIIE